MKRNRQTSQFKVALSLSSVIFVLGCKSETLTPLVKSMKYGKTSVDAHFCTLPRAVARQKIKYLFILDHSQSNKPGLALSPGDTTNTDPTGSRRYGALVQFVSGIAQNPNPNSLTYFSMFDFNDGVYTPKFNGNGAPLSGFDADATDFLENYVKPDWIGSGTSAAPSPNDSGFTNYSSALSQAIALIRADARAESLDPQKPIITTTYQIVFVTDGKPTIAAPPGSPKPTYTQDFYVDLRDTITRDLMGLKADVNFGPYINEISLNTTYYYNDTPDAGASSTLQLMAQAGHGQYLETSPHQPVMYQAFAPAIRSVRYNLSDIWVENLNAVAWDDGRILLDSDGDGLPDEIEEKLGSNPFSKDSDGNGVSDLIEYRTKGRPCNDLHCSVAGRDPYGVCDGFLPTVSGSTVTFSNPTSDLINMCEKYVIGASMTDFDSNGDFIPDLLSLRSGIPYLAGTNGAFLTPFGDALNNYSKLKFGYPTAISQSKVPALEPRVNTLVHEQSGDPDRDCYHFTSDGVTVINYPNYIKVTVIQNSSILDNKPVMMSATLPWNGFDSPVVFQPGDFQ